MALLSAQQILEASDTPSEDVDVPEWGGTVRVRTLTGAERDRFERSIRDRAGKLTMDNFRAKLVAMTAVDDAGKRIFADHHVEALGRKSAAGLDRAFAVAAKLCGMSRQDMDDLLGKDEPNSEPTA